MSRTYFGTKFYLAKKVKKNIEYANVAVRKKSNSETEMLV